MSPEENQRYDEYCDRVRDEVIALLGRMHNQPIGVPICAANVHGLLEVVALIYASGPEAFSPTFASEAAASIGQRMVGEIQKAVTDLHNPTLNRSALQ